MKVGVGYCNEEDASLSGRTVAENAKKAICWGMDRLDYMKHGEKNGTKRKEGHHPRGGDVQRSGVLVSLLPA